MKGYKKLACAIIACLMISSLIGCGNSSAASSAGGGTSVSGGEKIVWKLAHTAAEDTALHQAALMLAENLSKATDGNFVLEVYPNSQLGGNREAMEGAQFGTIEAVIPNVGNLGGYSTKVSALELPYLFNDITNFDDVNAVLNTEVMDPIRQEMEDAGFIWLGSWSQGNRELTTTKTPVHTPSDMKSLKIRTMESELHMAHFNALGANAVPMAFSEVFTALQQGAIDGEENPYCNIYTQGMHEVQGYIIETAHIFDVSPLLCSKTAFDALPAEYQKLLTDETSKLTMEEWEMADKQNEEYKQKIINAGKTEIIELSPEERQAFRDAAQPVYDKYSEKIGVDFIKAIQDAQE